MDAEEASCPLCMEVLDPTDQAFFPCPCRYQVCLWCVHHIREQMSGTCPACRQEYVDENFVTDEAIKEEAINRAKGKEKEAREALKEQEQAASAEKGQSKLEREKQKKRREELSKLATVRIVQRNVIYVMGIAPSIAKADILRRPEFFGQYGTLQKVSVNRLVFPGRNGTPGTAGNFAVSFAAYLTFATDADAKSAKESVDGFEVDGHTLRVTFGTTRYCQSFIKDVRCGKTDCTFLHALVEKPPSERKKRTGQRNRERERAERAEHREHRERRNSNTLSEERERSAPSDYRGNRGRTREQNAERPSDCSDQLSSVRKTLLDSPPTIPLPKTPEDRQESVADASVLAREEPSTTPPSAGASNTPQKRSAELRNLTPPSIPPPHIPPSPRLPITPPVNGPPPPDFAPPPIPAAARDHYDGMHDGDIDYRPLADTEVHTAKSIPLERPTFGTAHTTVTEEFFSLSSNASPITSAEAKTASDPRKRRPKDADAHKGEQASVKAPPCGYGTHLNAYAQPYTYRREAWSQPEPNDRRRRSKTEWKPVAGDWASETWKPSTEWKPHANDWANEALWHDPWPTTAGMPHGRDAHSYDGAYGAGAGGSWEMWADSGMVNGAGTQGIDLLQSIFPNTKVSIASQDWMKDQQYTDDSRSPIPNGDIRPAEFADGDRYGDSRHRQLQ